MRRGNRKITDASKAESSKAVIRLDIGHNSYYNDSIVRATVKSSTGNNGAFGVGATEAASLDFTIMADALPSSWTNQDIRCYMGYNVPDDSVVVGSAVVLSDVVMSGDTSSVAGFVYVEGLYNSASSVSGETAALAGEYSTDSDDSTAEVQDGAYVDVETLYMFRDEFYQMGLFATNDENVTKSGSFVSATAYDPFYWMIEECDLDWSPAYKWQYFSTKRGMALLCATYGIPVNLAGMPDVMLTKLEPYGTVRECISQICSAAFVNAMFDGAGTLMFRSPVDTGEVVGMGDYAAGSISVSNASRSSFDNVVSYYQSGQNKVQVKRPANARGSSVHIDPSMFGSLATREEIDDFSNDIEAISRHARATGRLGVGARGFSLTMFGGLEFELMDMFKAVALSGRDVANDTYKTSTYDLLVLDVSWEYDGSISTTLATESDTSAESSRSFASSANITAGQLAEGITQDDLLGFISSNTRYEYA